MNSAAKALAAFGVVFVSFALACASSAPPEKPTPGDNEAAEHQTEDSVAFTEEGPPEEGGPVDIRDMGAFMGSVGIVNGIPEGWPEDVPIVPGFSALSGARNTMGGLSARFEGSAAPAEVEAFYDASMVGWSKIEPPPALVLIKTGLNLSYLKGERVVDVTAGPADAESVSFLTVSHNWRLPPGKLPPNWPDEVPLMPGFEVKSASVGPLGEMDVVLVGSGELEEVVNYYATSLEGWTRVDPVGSPDMRAGRVAMVYEREGRDLVIRAQVQDEKTVVAIRVQDTS
jgi:hypothetical protein